MDRRNAIAQILESQASAAEVLTIRQFLEKYAPNLECTNALVSAAHDGGGIRSSKSGSSNSSDGELSSSSILDFAMRRTVIVPSEGCKPMPCTRAPPRIFQSLESLVDDAVWALVQRRERHRRLGRDGRNLLCLGYRIGDDGIGGGSGSTAAAPTSSSFPAAAVVVMTNLNHNVDYCKTSDLFRNLHKSVGDDVMRMVLLNCSVFVPVAHEPSSDPAAAGGGASCRGNYLQITGPPLRASSGASAPAAGDGTTTTATKKKIPSGVTHRKRKKPSYAADSDGDDASRQILASSAVIPRKGLFYQENYTPAIGLPPSHILNRPHLEPITLLHALVDLFDSSRPSRSRRRKRWRRVRDEGIPMCQDMVRRHKNTDYPRLLNHYCPLPDFCQKGNDHGSVSLPEAAASHCETSRVASYVRAALRRVLPPELLGCDEANWNQLLEVHVDGFVRLRRYEECANKTVLSGMKVTKVAWLFAGQRGTAASRSDHQAAHGLLTRVLRWILSEFVVPLLANCFYVTESELSGRQVLYYRKPVWTVFRALSMKKLLADQFVELTPEKARDLPNQQEMGFSRLRLFPKETGVRPIATLSKRELGPVQGPAQKKAKLTAHNARIALSTNRILGDAFAVLKYEHSQRDDLFGAGVHGLHYFYPRYRELLLKRMDLGAVAAPLYFASVDIQHCYDTINQEHLLKVLERQILSEDDYVIQQFDVLHPFASLGRVFRKRNVHVGPPEDFQPLSESVVELSRERHNSVFVDRVSSSVKRKDALLKQLHEHITSHLVVTKGRYGDRYLLQQNGIPQGSVISNLLCNFYYGNVEKSLLPPSHVPNAGPSENPTERCELLVRMVDDFLFVTSDLTRLRYFLKAMYKGDPALGVTVNPSKTNVSIPVSFESGDKTINLEPESGENRNWFAWCGMSFNVVSGEVKVDYTRFQSGRGGDVLTVDRVRRPGSSLAIAMKTFVRPRCSPILFDCAINSPSARRLNFYQLFALAAVKTTEHLRSSGMLASVDSNLHFLDSCIDSTIAYAYSLLTGRLPGNQLQLQRPVAFWLGLKAFADVFINFPELRKLTTLFRERLDGLPVSKNVRIVAATARKEMDIRQLF